MKAIRYILSLAAIAILGISAQSCKKAEPAYTENEIGVSVAGCDAPVTRAATVFNGAATLIDATYGGGNFTLNSYLSDSGDVFFADQWVNYFPDNVSNPWQFRVGSAFIKRIWPPHNRSLDFFAYMPYLGERPDYITNTSYTLADGPSFDCDMPMTKAAQDASKEFIYAFASNINKESNSGKVVLSFSHPFAAIYFKLKQGKRNMTVNSITFRNIHKAGTFTYAGDPQWSATDDSDNSLAIEVDKIIPDDINFGAIIDGPFLVMPQELTITGTDCADIVVNYTWDTHIDENIVLSIPAGAELWEPGKMYVYNLDLGNTGEVLFKVTVEAWDIQDYHIPIDVE